MSRLKVILEVNPDWNSAQDDREAHLDSIQRSFVGNLVLAIKQYKNVSLKIRNKNGIAAFNSETLRGNEFLFSYHIDTLGNSNVWTYKETAVIGKYSLEKSGYSGWSDISRNFDDYIAVINKLDLSYVLGIIEKQRKYFESTGLSKYAQSKRNEEIYPDKFVFYPMQRRADPVAQHSFIDAIDVLFEAARLAEETRTFLYVKLHPHSNTPAERVALLQLIATNKYIRKTEGDIHQLNSLAHSVIACNSGASFEALVFGTPVFCFGKSEWFEATHKLMQIEDIRKAFNDEIPERTLFQTKLIGYLLAEYWVDYDDFNAVSDRVREAMDSYQSEVMKEGETEFSIDHYIDEIHKKDIEIGKMKEKQYLINKDYHLLQRQAKLFLLSPASIIYRFFKGFKSMLK